MISSEDIQNRLDVKFDVPTVHYKGDKKLYKDDYATPIGLEDLKKSELNDVLLELAEAFSDPNDDGVVTDIPLIESDASIMTATVIWCDVREKIVKSKKEKFKNFSFYCQKDGRISVTYEGHKIVFYPNKYHGVTPESVRIKKTLVFYDGKSRQYRYVEIPIKMRYLSLVDDEAEGTIPVEKKDAVGRHLEYTIKLKGRQEHSKFLIPLTKNSNDAESNLEARKGTILLWPKFRAKVKETDWKAYYMYCDIEDSEKTLSFAPVLEKKEDGKFIWDVLPPVTQGPSVSI